MYRCYNPKRFFILLLLDAAAVIVLMLGSAIGRLVFSADASPKGVFLPIVMYHSVTPQASGSYQITPAMFEADLQYLSAHGYETVSTAQLVAYTNGTGTLPERPVMLTFDDGFYNNLSIVLPLLEQYDMCAVVSVVGSYTDVQAANDPHSDLYSYLTWEDINALLDSGRVEIGSHTYDLHSMEQRAGCSIMMGEDEESYTALLRADLEQLQQRMQEETGTAPTAFAYPYGYICRESIPVLREMGFLCSFTCYERPNDITRDPACLFGLDRYNRSGIVTTEEFWEQVLQQH